MSQEQEIKQLNNEIGELEKQYIEAKIEYEMKKADLLLNTDFATAIGKAKPTVAEKDAFVKMECIAEEDDYKMLGATIGTKKRLFDILLKTLGDD